MPRVSIDPDCATCLPYESAEHYRRIDPCTKCLKAMPRTLRSSWQKAYRERLILPHRHSEAVAAVMTWARMRRRIEEDGDGA